MNPQKGKPPVSPEATRVADKSESSLEDEGSEDEEGDGGEDMLQMAVGESAAAAAEQDAEELDDVSPRVPETGAEELDDVSPCSPTADEVPPPPVPDPEWVDRKAFCRRPPKAPTEDEIQDHYVLLRKSL